MLLAGCLAAGMVAVLALGYLQTRRASEMLVLGEGAVLLEMANQALKAAPPPPSSSTLQKVLETGAASGLKCVKVVGPRGLAVAEAGTCDPRPTPAAMHFSPRQVLWLGDRARMSSHPMGTEPGVDELGPPDEAPEGEPGAFPPLPPPHRMGPPPRVTIEFEPVLSAEVASSARVTAVAGAAMLLALIALSIVAARLIRFREGLIRQLEHEKHLSQVGEMSAVLAHEIRNPLAALKGHAQLLAKALPDDTREHAKAERVVSEAVRLEKLTTDLLSFVRSGTLECSDVEPSQLAREVATECGDGRVVVQSEGAPARWWLDPTRMRQVLANIIDNALHSSPEEASIDLSVGVEHGELLIQVRDRGAGIAAGDEERIFEPFQTGKARGTGLGLAVARRIVSLHGGRIVASNHEDGGALFRITIPGTR